MLSKKFLTVTILTSTLFMMSCGSSMNSANNNTPNPNQNPQSNPTPTPADQISKIGYEGITGTNLSAPSTWGAGIPVMGLDLTNKVITIRIPLGFFVNLTLAQNSIPELPNVTITTENDPSKGQFLVVRIPFKDVLKDPFNGGTATLPNGDPLPAVPAGETKPIATYVVKLNKSGKENLYLYLGKEYYAVMLQTSAKLIPTSSIYMITVTLTNKEKTKTNGFLHLINKKNNVNGGVMAAFQMPTQLAVLLDQLVHD